MSADPSKSPLSILLVEDHADTARATTALLSAMGHSVISADSVETAVRKVIDHRFDLIISDVGLPDGNGVSLMHGIRPFCDTPAIAMTGYGAEEDIERCRNAGFHLHLTKPVAVATLQDAIEQTRTLRA